MSSLAIPTRCQTISRSASASSLRSASSVHRRPIEHSDTLTPLTRSRRNSDNSMNTQSMAAVDPDHTAEVLTASTNPAWPNDQAGAPAAQSAWTDDRVPSPLVLPSGTPVISTTPSPSPAPSTRVAIAPSSIDLPKRQNLGNRDPSTDLRSGLASPNLPTGAVESLVSALHYDKQSVAHIHAGSSGKHFRVQTDVLTAKAPYFAALYEKTNGRPTAEDLTFADLDEFAFALFVRWCCGGKLHGPNDFHSMTHYLGLYVLALRFESEALQNDVMDLVRHYYHSQSMTAPAYRLEYIYNYTSAINHMRNFLTTTAAYRVLCEAPHPTVANPNQYLSDAIKVVIGKGSDLAVEFVEACVKLYKNGVVDVRRGNDCIWHVHSNGHRCPTPFAESWQVV